MRFVLGRVRRIALDLQNYSSGLPVGVEDELSLLFLPHAGLVFTL